MDRGDRMDRGGRGGRGARDDGGRGGRGGRGGGEREDRAEPRADRGEREDREDRADRPKSRFTVTKKGDEPPARCDTDSNNERREDDPAAWVVVGERPYAGRQGGTCPSRP